MMKEKIIAILAEVNDEVRNIGVDDDIISSEIIDSMDIISIVAELEEAFDIEIEGELITKENFQTISKIMNLVESIMVKKG